MAISVRPIQSPRLLIQACFGVLLGVLFSLLMVALFLPVSTNSPGSTNDLLNIVVDRTKVPEKIFYIATLFCGGIGAYLVTARRMPSINLYFLGCLVASMPVVNRLANYVFHTGNRLAGVITTSVILAIAVSYYFIESRRWQPIVPVPLSQIGWKFRAIPYSMTVMLITFILLPASFIKVAAHIAASSWNSHIVSYLVAPALYALGHGLLPGMDYFTQYSLGIGWIFSPMLGQTTQEAILNYTRLAICLTGVFYIQIFYLLSWLYRSWLCAAVITLLSLIFLFVIDVHFVAPSSQGVLRYPLLGVVAWLLAGEGRTSIMRQSALALTIAVSIFLNTETGIIIAVAVTVTRLITSNHFFATLVSLACLGAVSLFCLIIILFAVFGVGIFQTNFILYIVEPLILYGQSGMGGMPVAWTLHEFNMFYNLIAPTVAISTLALIARQAKSKSLIEQSRMIMLAFFTTTGLLMMFKYVNMSIVGVWQVNALCLLIPIGWWAAVGIRCLNNQTFNNIFILGQPLRLSYISSMLLVLCAVWMAAFSSDSRNPALYGIQSWGAYPSLVASLVGSSPKGCFDFECVTGQPEMEDIALIQARTRPGEQVAIISANDWVYLINAHRPPLIFFLPSTMIFTKRLLAETLTRLTETKYLFLPKDEHHLPVINGPLQEKLMPHFHQNYTLEAEGKKLAVWRRKNFS